MIQTQTLDSQILSARSYLFVPANRPDRYIKAMSAGADAVIVDLEDAVPPEEKNNARQQVAAWLTAERNVLLRVNGPETKWFEDDIRLCQSPGVAGIVLSKTQYVEELASVATIVPSMPILPLIETAIGFNNAEMLSRQPGVQRLVFGTLDFQIDMGIDGEGDELLYFRSKLVLISRLAHLQSPVDGISTHIKDTDSLKQETRRSRKIGFGGKLCIHPNQIAPVNESFLPTAEQTAWAERVIEASEHSGGNPVAVDGTMVDLPVVLLAEGILRASRRGM